VLTVFFVSLEHALGVGVEQRFTRSQPLLGIKCQGRPREIELANLPQPRLELLQVNIVRHQIGVGELVGCSLLGDLSLEVLSLVEEFGVLLITVSLETDDHLFCLPAVECDRLQQDGIAGHLTDLVLNDLEASRVIVSLGK